MHKLTLLIGVGIGYVLGAKAGRERYEQFADQASKAWSDPRVQSKVEEVKEQAPVVAAKVKEQAPVVAGKVSDAAKSVADRARSNGDDEVADEALAASDALEPEARQFP